MPSFYNAAKHLDASSSRPSHICTTILVGLRHSKESNTYCRQLLTPWDALANSYEVSKSSVNCTIVEPIKAIRNNYTFGTSFLFFFYYYCRLFAFYLFCYNVLNICPISII